jgi:hypothetical protein
MKQSPRHLGTLLVWTVLVGLCWQANAQKPHPPLPIPAAAQNATGDWRATLPPPEFDYEYKGQMIVTKWNDYSLIRHICKDIVPPAVACSYRTYELDTGKPVSCLIILGPLVWDDPRTLRHEIAHCNGWGADHKGARK